LQTSFVFQCCRVFYGSDTFPNYGAIWIPTKLLFDLNRLCAGLQQ